MSQTSMIQVRLDEQLKNDAAEKLANVGLTISEAVRILLTRVSKEGGMPPNLVSTDEQYDSWFKSKVEEALAADVNTYQHENVMDDIQAIIDGNESDKDRMDSTSKG
mgnify:CR=1 FL=1